MRTLLVGFALVLISMSGCSRTVESTSIQGQGAFPEAGSVGTEFGSGIQLPPAVTGEHVGWDTAPIPIVNLGRELGCRIPGEDIPGVVVAWIEDASAGQVYAAWCARESQRGVVFDLLVSTASPQHPWARCEPHIKLGREEPAPYLQVTTLPAKESPYSFSDFWYLGEDYALPGQRVDDCGSPIGPGLRFSDREDAGNLLVCLDGRWIMTGFC
jgi:hypothetical protein